MNRKFELYRRVLEGDQPTAPKVNPTPTYDAYKSAVAVEREGGIAGNTIKPQNPPTNLENYQEAVSKPTNTDNRPASWQTLSSFLTNNIDANRDWDAEEIADLSILNEAIASGKINNEQRAEGMIAFQNYLSDVQAQKAYSNAMAEAENTARRNTAYNDYLASRLASYLKEVQGTSGLEGYDGVTKGQAINLANLEANRQAEVNAQRQQTETGALEAYQNALLENSQAYTDQYGSLMSARDEKDAVAYQEGLAFVDALAVEYADDNGNISQSNFDKIKDYINNIPNASDEAKKKLMSDVEALYGNDVIPDSDAESSEASALAETLRNTITRDNFDTEIGKLTEEQKAQASDVIAELEKQFFPIGRGEVAEGVKADYKAGYYTFTYDGKTYTVMERITKDPLGSDTGTLNYNESVNRFGVPNPKNASYGDILVVEKDGIKYFYVKRNTKWYYLCNENETEGTGIKSVK